MRYWFSSCVGVRWRILFLEFLGLFNFFMDLCGKCLDTAFGLKSSTFGCIVSPKVRWNSTKIKIFSQNFYHFGRLRGSFWTIFGVKKTQVWEFSKVVLELFRKYLGIVFVRLKMLTFGCIFSSKSWKMVFKTEISGQILTFRTFWPYSGSGSNIRFL